MSESPSESTDRVVAAPISWGVSEVRGWGVQLPTERVLGEAASLGFKHVEAGPPDFLPSDPEMASEFLERFDMDVVAGFVDSPLHVKRGLPAVEERIERLSEIGAKVMVLASTLGGRGYDDKGELDDADWWKMISAIEKISAFASNEGIDVVMHPHIGTAVASSEDVKRLLEDSDVKLCFDTGHLTLGGIDILQLLADHGDRIGHVHLKDIDPKISQMIARGTSTYGDAVNRGIYVPLGTGSVDIEGVLGGLDAAGYDGWLVVEQDVQIQHVPLSGDGPIVGAKISMECLRDHLSGAIA